MKKFTVLLAVLFPNFALAVPYLPLEGITPVTHYEHVGYVGQRGHEFVGGVQINGGRVYHFRILLTQSEGNENHYSGIGSIRLEYRRQENGPVEKVCHYPISISMMVLGGTPRRQAISFGLPAALPTDQVSLRRPCPAGREFTELTQVWGPAVFQRQH